MFRILRRAHRDLPAAAQAAGTRRSAAVTIAAALTMASPDVLPAATVSATMNVSCQVMARAVVAIESSPASIVVTAEDVARGFAEMTAPIVLRTRTNSRAGYLLEASRITGDFTAVEVSYAGGSFKVTESGVMVQRPYVAGGERLAFSAKLRLAPATTPGTYPLPLVFTASPL
jgi:hypothetical protein